MRSTGCYCICLSALLSLFLSTNAHAGDSLLKADSLYRAGKYDAAITLLEKNAVPEFEARGDTVSLIKAWSILGCCHVENGNIEAADKYCNLTIDAVNYYGEDFYYVTNTLYNLAQMYHRIGSYDEALEYIDRSIEYELGLGRKYIIARRYFEKASILIDMGDYQGALAVIDEASPVFENLNNPHFRSEILYLKGLCYEAVGNNAAASEIFSHSEFADRFNLYESEFPPVPGLTNKMGDYAMAERDTATAGEMYRFSIKTAAKIHEYDKEVHALRALAGICGDSDPDASARLNDRADSLTFSPYVSELALKMALVGIEFPRREREQQLQIQRMRIMSLGLTAALLAIIAIMLYYRSRATRSKAEYERERAETLERELDQKQRLLELAESSSDNAFSQKVRQIAGEIGQDAGLTKREREICALIKQGLINKEIADKLNISLRTVENHRNAIYRKFGVNNTAGLLKVLEEILDK